MQFMPGGSLHSLLHEKKVPLTFHQRLKLARDVAVGLDFVHEKQIIHRDIKTSNILVHTDCLFLKILKAKCRLYNSEDNGF